MKLKKPSKYKNLSLIVIFVLILLVTVFKSSNKYSNSEFNYEFYYPKNAKLTFISSLTDSIDIQKADTLSIEYSSGKSIRIQVFKTGSDLNSNLCNYHVGNKNITLCLFPKDSENVSKDPQFQELIKTIKF